MADIRPSNCWCGGREDDDEEHNDEVVLPSLCCLVNHNDLAVSVSVVSRAWGTGIIGRGDLTFGGEEVESMIAVAVTDSAVIFWD